MTIWKEIAVLYKDKIAHVKKICGKTYYSFIVDCGSVPVARWNEVSGKWEEVVNARGRAYAARKRQIYRRRVK